MKGAFVHFPLLIPKFCNHSAYYEHCTNGLKSLSKKITTACQIVKADQQHNLESILRKSINFPSTSKVRHNHITRNMLQHL